MDVVKEILEKSEKFKPISVDKYIEFDLGALMALDSNEIDEKALKKTTDDYLLSLTRDNTQLLFNEIWQLETHRLEDEIVAKLPRQRFVLPRFRPVPRPRALTKWQQFAKDKGIVDKKSKTMKTTWDEQLQKWIPTYGFKRAAADREKNWLLEVPDNADPMEDQFAKRMNAKSEKVAKNELQRLRNIAKTRRIQVPRFGVTSTDEASAKQLQVAVTVAKSSTASLGKFQTKLPHEKVARGITSITPGASRKRKLAPVSAQEEKAHTLAIVDEVLNKKPKLSVEKAVSRQINEEQLQRSEEKNNTDNRRQSSRGMKKSSKNGGSKFSAKKPKNPKKGQHKGGKVSGGRKRR